MLKDVFQFIMIVGIGGAFCGGFLLSAAVSSIVRFFYKYADDEMQIKLDKNLDKLIIPCAIIGATFMYISEYT